MIQIGLSLVVWRAVERGWPGLLALAVLCHALIDFPVALAQAGQLSSSIVEGLLLGVGLTLGAFFAYKLPPKVARHSPD